MAEAIEKLGGIYAACHAAKTTPTTMYAWNKAGEIRLLKPALRLAKASGIPIERFAPDWDKD